jgi:hypothetical protein
LDSTPGSAWCTAAEFVATISPQRHDFILRSFAWLVKLARMRVEVDQLKEARR